MAVVSTVMNINFLQKTEFLYTLRDAVFHSAKTCGARPTPKPPTGICFIMDLLCQAFVTTWKKKAFWIITVSDPAVDILASLEQKQ